MGEELIEEKEELLPRVEQLKMARAIKQKEADHRREKRWRIFSWASSLLLGSIAGAVAITANRAKSLPWIPYRVSLVFAVLVLAAYAILWTAYNGKILEQTWERIKEIDRQLGIYQEEEPPSKRYKLISKIISYGVTIGLLAAASILIIVLS